MDTINSDMRTEIGKAVENHHLNKTVFALIRKLDKMDPPKLFFFLEDLEHYLDISGLAQRADNAMLPGLQVDGQGAKEEDDGEADEAKTGNGAAHPGTAEGGQSADDDKVTRPLFGKQPTQVEPPGGGGQVRLVN